MSKSPDALGIMPPLVLGYLKQLGENLAIARVRRKESQRNWAKRLGVSIPTLIRMEKGEPGVSMTVYATALWLIGRIESLPGLADPKLDYGAIEEDVKRASKRRAVRTQASIKAKLERKNLTIVK